MFDKTRYAGKKLGDLVKTANKFLIEDLIHGKITMLYARPKVGKSLLAMSAAIALSEGTDWLGRKVEQKFVGYWAMDGGQADEMRERFEDLGSDTGSEVVVFDRKPEDTDEWWDGWIDYLADEVEVLFIDNLLALKPGDVSVNDDASMGAIFERIGAIVSRGIAVVVIHHAPKMSEDILKTRTPMGSTIIESSVRYLIRAERDWEKNSALVTLVAGGNAGAAKEFQVALYPKGMGNDGAFVTLLEERLNGDIPEDETMEQALERARMELRKKQGQAKPAERKQQERDGDNVSRVVDYLKNNAEPVNQGTIREATKMSNTKLRGVLATLEKDGKAKQTKGAGNAVLWELTA
ncbi:AAA family ATPase [Streptomyces sp. NPDC002276]